jgi:hypothetical protein
MTEDDPEKTAQAREKLRGFAIHLLAYFVVMAALVAVNLTRNPEYAWSLFPVVAWGAVLAVHAAWVMGLFGGQGR